MTQFLNSVAYGERSSSPLLIAHGLFGTARNWGVLSKRFALGHSVTAVDMRNHGESFHADTNSYFDMATDLADVIRINGAKSNVLGHSMGGKAAMVLALTYPDLVGKLVVADIAPVGYAHSQSDKIAAMRAVDLDVVKRRGDADKQLAASIDDPQLRAFLLQSLSLGSSGASWKVNLDALDASMSDIIGFPEMQGAFDGEVLFLSGGSSGYVQTKDHDKIREFFPNSHFAQIEGAGHWLHAEKPREFESVVSDFLT